jgi:cyclic pyranopterin phosphate synthase
MVDVADKPETDRMARARGEVRVTTRVLEAIREGKVPKGDVLATARLAGIGGAKLTSTLLPLCHPVRISWVEVTAETSPPDRILIEATVRGKDRTGFEMEAFTAVATAALSVVDMVKALDPSSSLLSVRLVEKRGGKSGHWVRDAGS